MRKQLAKLDGIRDTFTGEFVRFGIKNGYKGVEHTVLLKEVRDISGKIITDHLWFNLTKGFEKINLKEGDIVQFDARVTPYVKGYFGRRDDVFCQQELDYKLAYPSKITKIEKGKENGH